MIVETKHLRLIPCDVGVLKAAIDGNDKLGRLLNIDVSDRWTEFGTGPLHYALGKLSEDIEHRGWFTYLPVYKPENRLIGNGGYKGKPDESGTVEIGYEIAPEYRGKGLATEMAEGLVTNAFSDFRIKMIVAHTLPEENASTTILTKCGFMKVKDIDDPDDGLIWQWLLNA